MGHPMQGYCQHTGLLLDLEGGLLLDLEGSRLLLLLLLLMWQGEGRRHPCSCCLQGQCLGNMGRV